MLKTLNLQNKVEDCVSSYESRIENIASVCENAHAVLYGFQKSFLDTNREREEIAAKLQNTLAQNEHLRKKDFELIMRRAGVAVQEGREKEVKDLLDIYFNEQKEMAKKLRENLDGFKVSLAKGEARRIREFQTLLKDIFVRQNERKEEVTAKLKEFKEERNETALKLKGHIQVASATNPLNTSAGV